MKLTKLGSIFLAGISFALMTNAIMLWQIYTDYQRASQAERLRFESLQLTYAIEKDVSQLSWFVKAYTSTADFKYLKYYYDLRDMMSGKKARPDGYSTSYWAEVIAGYRHYQLSTDPGKSLTELLKENDFSASEQSLFKQMLQNIAQMSRIEQIAFASTQGLYDPINKIFIDDGEPNLVYAAQVLNEQDYLSLNADLLKTVLAITEAVNTRNLNSVNKANDDIKKSILYAFLMLVISILFMMMIAFLVRRDLLKPIPEINHNAGFDGAVVYYNKKTSVLKFSGAETDLFMMTDDGAIQLIKGSRQSVGYKKSSNDFVFTDHHLSCDQSMIYYITTDGFLDQMGGEKGFSFGKRRFQQLLSAIKHKPLHEQSQLLDESLLAYQGSLERNDDITVVAFRCEQSSIS